VLTQTSSGAVKLRALFHPEIAQLAAEYLGAAAGYIERYSASLGPYPYTEFTIVSSPLPTGFGMPGFTYLGIEVLKLPFIKSTSLGHEVLHNWWGNGVYVDWPRGNWSEGLTTFMADYAYKEDESAAAAREARLNWLRNFAAVPSDRDAPLRAFTSRTHDASQIVGYDKAAFLFFMLRDEIGADAFASALRDFFRGHRFQRASWSDLERAFAKRAGRDLHSFFAQWLDRTGAPTLSVAQARFEPHGSGYRIEAQLAQPESAYALRVPLVVRTDRGEEERVVHVDAALQTVALETTGRPVSLTVDPQLRVFRRLDAREIPPTLRQVTLDASSVTLIAGKDGEVDAAARALAARLMDVSPRYVERVPSDASAMVIGLAADVDAALSAAHLPARPERLGNRGTAQVWAAQLPNGKTLLAISASDAASLQALSRPLPHYGKQSWLVFEGSKAVERGVWETRAVSWLFR
jgi:hypothetical protein